MQEPSAPTPRTTADGPTHAQWQALVVQALQAVLPPEGLLWTGEQTTPYECDGLTAYRQRPLAVALPATPAQVQAVLQTCHRLGVPVVARGAGTGLSGGALPHERGVTLSLARFNQIVKIDPLARTARVQCGVRNLAISEAAAAHGLYYAPDPSSQIACTIGGNVAENSGGVHCLKYGLTLHNVLAVKGFTVEGEPVEFGGEALDAPGYDLLAVVTGSEGMLAVTTEVTVRLLPRPQLARCTASTPVGALAKMSRGIFLRKRAFRPFPCAGRWLPALCPVSFLVGMPPIRSAAHGAALLLLATCCKRPSASRQKVLP